MSCNGCRVLRKGCNEFCVLRHSLQWINNPEAQAHATAFLAKYFGRSTLLSFLSTTSEIHRAALFRSLLYEACARTVNPVDGAIGLVWTGNWRLCQMAVETVLHGGAIRAMSIPNIASHVYQIPEDLSKNEDKPQCEFQTTLSMNSEECLTMSYDDGNEDSQNVEEHKLLDLFT
ncbi:LOB domain-containing protein 37 [Ranunculus cassubicifolius]